MYLFPFTDGFFGYPGILSFDPQPNLFVMGVGSLMMFDVLQFGFGFTGGLCLLFVFFAQDFKESCCLSKFTRALLGVFWDADKQRFCKQYVNPQGVFWRDVLRVYPPKNKENTVHVAVSQGKRLFGWRSAQRS